MIDLAVDYADGADYLLYMGDFDNPILGTYCQILNIVDKVRNMYPQKPIAVYADHNYIPTNTIPRMIASIDELGQWLLEGV